MIPFSLFEKSMKSLIAEKEFNETITELGVFIESPHCADSLTKMLALAFYNGDIYDERWDIYGNPVFCWVETNGEWCNDESAPTTIKELYELFSEEAKEMDPISLEFFKDTIKKISEDIQFQRKCSEAGLDIKIDLTAPTIDLLEVLMEDKYSSIWWWLFDKECGAREDMDMFDKDENIIPMNTVEDLYNYLKGETNG